MSGLDSQSDEPRRRVIGNSANGVDISIYGVLSASLVAVSDTVNETSHAIRFAHRSAANSILKLRELGFLAPSESAPTGGGNPAAAKTYDIKTLRPPLTTDQALFVLGSKYALPPPSYGAANSLKFSELARRLEEIERNRTNIRSRDDLLEHILPKELCRFLKEASPKSRNYSVFPWIR